MVVFEIRKKGKKLKPGIDLYYQEYISGINKDTGINIIDKRAMKILFGEDQKKGIKEYKSFVEEKEDLFEYDPKIDIFGNTRFVTKLRRIS